MSCRRASAATTGRCRCGALAFAPNTSGFSKDRTEVVEPRDDEACPVARCFRCQNKASLVRRRTGFASVPFALRRVGWRVEVCLVSSGGGHTGCGCMGKGP